MRKVARIGDRTRLVRVGRDGKNRYCLFYYEFVFIPEKTRRIVVAGKLTKLEARGMLKLLEK